ncbi:PAQR family membrane homeostasis protein TrhA [Flammeovirga kamogawensis]|uniref:Hemolysin III family protein n=1 Tax=Flammeovirga kamogawensis TaxID=373891 RepID=A0ABX8GZ98_9BACT|nr:hemolysin III family protein [Flammeovirga kamogawensis]MBB6459094.1 hemolysin III [Flammeovirga kamogawensis]QWG08663.1 hemolysin III family protein [Flammeovirga kamogawensis]TRX66956.1 hemolysin III family protein [Flammeovirga kamogawensis]
MYTITVRDREEVWNTITHAIGVVLSSIGLILLLVKANSTLEYIVYIIFGVSMISLYLSSTMYHLIADKHIKSMLQKLDHSGIFFLIAGTYTPFAFLALENKGGMWLGIVVWSIAFLGMTYKLFFKIKYEWLSNVAYLAMGWVAVFKMSELHTELANGFWLLIAGGIAYSLGVVFFVWEKLKYNHAIWHLFVLLGSVLMFLSIYLYT